MKLADVIAQIKADCDPDIFLPFWEESIASMVGGLPAFLQQQQMEKNREWSGLGLEIAPELEKTRRLIVENEDLVSLAWHCYNLLFRHIDYNRMAEWPSLEKILGEHHGAFYLIVAMGMVSLVQETHRTMSIPEEFSRSSCLQISSIAGNYWRMTGGQLGVPLRQLYWLRHYTAGRLFRLGRLEYMLKPFAGNIDVYRNTKTRQTVALASDGTTFSHEGYINKKADWTATQTLENGVISGYPVSPRGFALRSKIVLAQSEWVRVLQNGDLTLEMHIPAGGSMRLETCGQSLRSAANFFRSYFPDRQFCSIVSNSWIFNNQLEDIKLSSDNLVRFQRELYLFPTYSTGCDGWWFIFFRDDFDLKTAPRESSLQRGVADFIAAGNTWRGGRMFFLIDDLVDFGTQVYRRNFARLS